LAIHLKLPKMTDEARYAEYEHRRSDDHVGVIRIHDYGYKKPQTQKREGEQVTVAYLEGLVSMVERFKAIFNSRYGRELGYDGCFEGEIGGVKCVLDPSHIIGIMPKADHDRYEGVLKEKQGIEYDCDSLSFGDLRRDVKMGVDCYVSDKFPTCGFDAGYVNKAIRVFYPRRSEHMWPEKIRVHFPTNKAGPLVLSTYAHDHIILIAPRVE